MKLNASKGKSGVVAWVYNYILTFLHLQPETVYVTPLLDLSSNQLILSYSQHEGIEDDLTLYSKHP